MGGGNFGIKKIVIYYIFYQFIYTFVHRNGISYLETHRNCMAISGFGCAVTSYRYGVK